MKTKLFYDNNGKIKYRCTKGHITDYAFAERQKNIFIDICPVCKEEPGTIEEVRKKMGEKMKPCIACGYWGYHVSPPDSPSSKSECDMTHYVGYTCNLYCPICGYKLQHGGRCRNCNNYFKIKWHTKKHFWSIQEKTPHNNKNYTKK